MSKKRTNPKTGSNNDDQESPENLVEKIMTAKKDANNNEIQFYNKMNAMRIKLDYVRDISTCIEQSFDNNDNVKVMSMTKNITTAARFKYLNENYLKKTEECETLRTALETSQELQAGKLKQIEEQARLINELTKKLLQKDQQIQYKDEQLRQQRAADEYVLLASLLPKKPAKAENNVKRVAKPVTTALNKAEKPLNSVLNRAIAKKTTARSSTTTTTSRGDKKSTPQFRKAGSSNNTSRNTAAITGASKRKAGRINRRKAEADPVPSEPVVHPMVQVKQEPLDCDDYQEDHFNYACYKIKLEPRESSSVSDEPSHSNNDDHQYQSESSTMDTGGITPCTPDEPMDCRDSQVDSGQNSTASDIFQAIVEPPDYSSMQSSSLFDQIYRPSSSISNSSTADSYQPPPSVPAHQNTDEEYESLIKQLKIEYLEYAD